MTAAITVVVPAHNEAELLPKCLSALMAVRAAVTVPVTVVVVFDASTDGSDLDVPPGVDALVVDFRNVGSARAAGFHAFGDGRDSDTWFCTTDADSEVNDDWLSNQLRHSTVADVVVGTVRIDEWRHHPAATRDAFVTSYGASDGNDSRRHVHGASLGVRADAYWSVGGFRSLQVGEDQDLVDRLAASGRSIAWVDDLCVSTSDRVNARAPQGFADDLNALTARSW